MLGVVSDKHSSVHLRGGVHYLTAESLHALALLTQLGSESVLIECGCGAPFVAVAAAVALQCRVLAIDLPDGKFIR